MKTITAMFAVAAVLVLAAGASAGTVYVDAAASPGGNGSEGAPYQTIQAGISAALAGDEVVVAQGLYNEHIDFLGKDIVVRSTDPTDASVVDATIVDGTDSGTVVTIASGETAAAVLDGLTIRNGRWDDQTASHGGGVHIENASPTITNNVVTLNYSKTDGAGVCVLGGASPLLQGNTIVGNMSDGWGGGVFVFGDTSDPENPVLAEPDLIGNRITGNIAQWDGGGVAAFEACTVLMKSNVVDSNSAGEVGGGVFVGYGVAAQIENNTLADNDALGTDVDDNGTPVARVGRGGGLACWFSGATVADSSILWGNTAKGSEGDQVSLEGTAALTIQYSDASGGEPAAFKEATSSLTWGSGMANIDPKFADAASGDYHLKSYIGRVDPATGEYILFPDTTKSPMIDAGNPALAFDIEPWPHGTKVNAGGYGQTAEASLSGVPFTIAPIPDSLWMYQNIASHTLNRHRCHITVSVYDDPNGNSTYQVVLEKTGGTGVVTFEDVAGEPLQKDVVGGPAGQPTAGPVNVHIMVFGDVGGGNHITFTFTVRKLGDIDNNNSVDLTDMAWLNDRINVVGTPPFEERAYNVNGDASVDLTDKAMLNDLLNTVIP